jgi:hypothetical protein
MSVCLSTQIKRTSSPVLSSTDFMIPSKVINELPHSPPKVTLDKIDKMTDITILSGLETKYDEFLEKNGQILLLLYFDNIIDELIEIRNALTSRVSRLHREQQMKENVKQPNYCEYNHNYQTILPLELQLTQEQIKNGYIPCPNEPKEFKCGCLSIKYYSRCCCKNDVNSICKNPKCNENINSLIKTYSYCETHKNLKNKLDNLEIETEKYRKELLAIKRQSNSLDYEDYKNSLSNNNNKRISRFPWKNI